MKKFLTVCVTATFLSLVNISAFDLGQPPIDNDDGEGVASMYRTVGPGSSAWSNPAAWEVSTDGGANWVPATSPPNSGDGAITIRSSHTITVTADVTADQLWVESLANLAVNNGVTFTIADGPGADLVVSFGGFFSTAGTVVNNAGKNKLLGDIGLQQGGTITGNALAYDSSARLSYSNSTPRTTTDVEFPAIDGPPNVTMDGPGGITLHASRRLEGTLGLNSGNISTGANTLILLCTASVAAGGPSSYVIGNLAKEFCATGSFTYPTGTTPNGAARPSEDVPEGTPVGEYSPVVINVTNLTTNPSTLTVSATDTWMLGLGQTSSLSRYWTVNETGEVTADMTFQYLAEDVHGNEPAYQVFKNSGGSTTTQPGSVNAGADTFTATGVTAFSNSGAGVVAPSAAGVSISGRVMTADGGGISKARITITGNSLIEPRVALTASFGYYQIDGLTAGETYVVTVGSKRFTFQAPSRVINLDDNVTGLDFVADP